MKIFDFINRLSNISRWSQAHCNRNESVLEHTSFVAIYSLKLCFKHEVDIGTTITRALLHDMEEIMVGDIPHPTKYFNHEVESSIKKLENICASEISENVFGGKAYEHWVKSKDRTMAGQIVRLADCAAVAYKIWQEIETGNKEFLSYIPNVLFALSKIYITTDAFLLKDISELKDFILEIQVKNENIS